MKQNANGGARRGCSGRSTSCSNRQQGTAATEMHRYAHPIEQTRRSEGGCDGLRLLLCALTGQMQMICAMKAELDEIRTLLKAQTAKKDENCEEESAREP